MLKMDVKYKNRRFWAGLNIYFYRLGTIVESALQSAVGMYIQRFLLLKFNTGR